VSAQDRLLVALAGQPNCGKSTVFNMLTGAHQHVANYPGVTVEKKSGSFRVGERTIDLVDLPGTYSLTSYSLEERVARDFLLQDKPDLCINVADVSTLRRGLYLTLQIMEMDCPLVLTLNMMDKARKDGVDVNMEALSRYLGVPVVGTSAAKGEGKDELIRAVLERGEGVQTPRQVDYGPLEEKFKALDQWMRNKGLMLELPRRWLFIKLLEGDEYVGTFIRSNIPEGRELLDEAARLGAEFEAAQGQSVSRHVAVRRYALADEAVRSCQKKAFSSSKLTNAIDSVVCHKILGPIILVGVIYLLYQLSIVQGYNLTNYTWPLLAKLKEWTGLVMPQAGFVEDPMTRSLALWVVDSVNALLNYVPIFFILFGLIAVLEDSGYMPRMAFILDRLLKRFGLHGQSTLALVLGGVYVGGCAVPAIMATKGVPDHRARLATILVIPMLNCLAKVPLYVLLISTYFAEHKGWAMFFISTISLIMALPVAKILTMTVLRGQESAPFIMEMPDYHVPTLSGVLRSALQKVWLFIKKITSIVVAVAVIVFALLRFPGISEEAMRGFDARGDKIMADFMVEVEKSPAGGKFAKEDIMDLLDFEAAMKQAKIRATTKEAADRVDADFRERNPLFLSMLQGDPKEEFGAVGRAFRKMNRDRRLLRLEAYKERIDNSFLGRISMALEPVSQWAGFNWRVNVALLSALAAKENTVATLGALYQQDAAEADDLGASMRRTEDQFTPLHALALMLFMVLYPPCLATLITIKLQTGSYAYLFLSLFGQITLAGMVATCVFTGGNLLGLSGLQAMFSFYGLALAVAVGVGFLPLPQPEAGRSAPPAAAQLNVS
jgi:ferrous iron transport protein B